MYLGAVNPVRELRRGRSVVLGVCEAKALLHGALERVLASLTLNVDAQDSRYRAQSEVDATERDADIAKVAFDAREDYPLLSSVWACLSCRSLMAEHAAR